MSAAPNVRFRHILGEGPALYAVRDDGALLWQKMSSTTSAPTAITAGNCNQIGAGWQSFLHVFSGGVTAEGIILYAVDAAGGLHWYCDTRGDGSNAPSGATGWARGSGNQIGEGWDQFVHLLSGGNGIIYAIRPNGELLWYRDLWQNGANASNGTTGWATNSGNQIGAGWNQFTYVVSGGGGFIYAVKPTGELLWYEDLWQNGTNAASGTTGWATNSGSQIGAGWDQFTYVLSCRSGVLLGALIQEYGGNLLWFKDLLQNGTNAKDGTTGYANGSGAFIGQGWQIAPIEGYCTPPGAAAGGTIRFFVSANLQQPFSLSFVRMTEVTANVYGAPAEPPPGAPAQLLGSFQTTDQQAWKDGCGAWTESFSIQIPPAWPSGVYAARCIDANYCKYDIVFTVQPGSATHNKLLVLVNTNTWNAYNIWGGISNYTYDHSRPNQFSYLRPNLHLLNCPFDNAFGNGGKGGNHLLRGEIWLLDWLQTQILTYDTTTDWDFHSSVDSLAGYSAIILSTHPEYWSVAMQERLIAYLAGGGCLIHLGGNGMFRMVAFSTDLTNFSTSYTYGVELFRNGAMQGAVGERQIFGISSFGSDGVAATPCPYTILAPSNNPIIAAGGFVGNTFGATGRNGPASGWEVEVTFGQAPDPNNWSIYVPDRTVPPPDVIPLAAHTATNQASIVSYGTASGGSVFSVGSINFVGSLVWNTDMGAMVAYVIKTALLLGEGPLARRPGRLAAPFGTPAR